MKAKHIEIYDTTLRDGSQGSGMSLSCEDKVRIAQRLDAFGIPVIEGGWPGSNPKDIEFFLRARDIEWSQARLAAFGSTCRTGIAVEDDENLKLLLDAQTPICTIVGKAWTYHVTEVLRTSYDDNLLLIENSVAFLKAHHRQVVFDAEHFFDGYRDDSGYATAALQAAARGGADVIALCDSNGGATPWDVETIIASLDLSCVLGIHCHNDSDCGTANSLAAVRAGATHVQGTINGYGERCGNANLCAVIPNLELKFGFHVLPEGRLAELTEVSRYVADISGMVPPEHMAYVGRSAFSHKGGIHVAAVRRSKRSYEHVEPAVIGNQTQILVSELAGRGNLLVKAEEYGIDLHNGSDVTDVLRQIKQDESRGFSYEAAEASVALLLLRQAPDYQPPYRLVDYMVNVEHRDGRGTFAEATVKVEIGGRVEHTAAEGDGPVHALDLALRKALARRFPELASIRLADYKVRILDGATGTMATTRVFIDSTNGAKHWRTVGASSNIIEASWRALSDAIEYGLSLANVDRQQQSEPDHVQARKVGAQ